MADEIFIFKNNALKNSAKKNTQNFNIIIIFLFQLLTVQRYNKKINFATAKS